MSNFLDQSAVIALREAFFAGKPLRKIAVELKISKVTVNRYYKQFRTEAAQSGLTGSLAGRAKAIRSPDLSARSEIDNPTPAPRGIGG